MKNVAIIGAGPTGIYTFYALLERGKPLAITVYEQAEEAGVGMPYSDDNNASLMLANIASIEIPPIFITYLQWLRGQSDGWLARWGLERASLHERQFLPRVMLGDYYHDRFLALVKKPGSWDLWSTFRSPVKLRMPRRRRTASTYGWKIVLRRRFLIMSCSPRAIFGRKTMTHRAIIFPARGRG